MSIEPEVAFSIQNPEPPALEIRVNFGVFAGRDATSAEIDDLAKALLPKIGEVAIVSEERHELSEQSEVSLHQVRIEVDPEQLPNDAHELDHLAGRLVEAADAWARACAAERHTELSEL
ncbi:MAG: hypothetical protein M3R70_02610 [Actinomycetota bacterium]|nr:hypothetical protein [Actinomycetota bacterium]